MRYGTARSKRCIMLRAAFSMLFIGLLTETGIARIITVDVTIEDVKPESLIDSRIQASLYCHLNRQLDGQGAKGL